MGRVIHKWCAALWGGLVLLCLALAGPASAHPVPFSYLDLVVEPGALDGKVRVHLRDAAPMLGIADPADLLNPQVREAHRQQFVRYLSERITLNGDTFRRAEWGPMTIVDANEAIEITFDIAGKPPGGLTLDTDLFPVDPLHQTFVNIYEGNTLRQQWIFSHQAEPRTYYRGTTAGALAVMATFIPAGTHHILIGPDHLLFLFALLLLGGGWRRLLRIVTAFTIGHSITLTLATLDIVNPPSRLVEPGIALTIIVVGVDNLLQSKGEGRDLRAWAALLFGLIHGFGFASVLKEFGLPQEALGWSLFSFNVGVELGQLAVVLVVATLLAAIRRKFPAAITRVVQIGSVLVIAGGAYWFVERVFFGGYT
ncbi:MAG: HupE/UreJ family protein [Croceibacterium sp.]